MKRHSIFLIVPVLLLLAVPAFSQKTKQPNFIIILADDLGYGDLGIYGHPTIRTPNLDKMALEGTRFTQFYVAANVCSPSRAALLTGRLPVRNGVFGTSAANKVFFTNSTSGLPKRETTLAKALKGRGYQTAIVGKWHLGSLPEFLPTQYGFDAYFGIPYSNDMGRESFRTDADGKPVIANNPRLPLYRNTEVVETEPDQNLLTKRFTSEVTDLITKNRSKPFFIYYASPFPHVPLHASPDFAGKSKRGIYGDVVEELDWSVGQILNKLKELKLDKNTFVVFLSDNGPWLMKSLIDENGGSAGLLYEAKGSTYEGGMRVPAIAWMPGTVKTQVSSAVATSMDLYPTILKWAGAAAPADTPLDGNDITGIFTGSADKVTDIVYYYENNDLYAIRKGPYKLHFKTNASYSQKPAAVHNPPLLYNLEHDPSEKFEIGRKYPQVIEELTAASKKHLESVKPVDAELDKREAKQ
ncbi:sulfatase family protein [Dyadobacter sandarakinus]|uniref:Sulfatase n=1 Tax=Dyadobacter sandarakinus TaxID=2747268 RepID=A0ABX7I2E6_9BACT|nr:sulfatase [Dyadobacter sandarakinus]QRR00257.1 sulfatase [Dyadobacter sandarakinus]